MKDILNCLFVMFCTVCAFGGGAVFGIAFCWIFDINGKLCSVIVVSSLFFFSVLSFYLIEKFNDKF